MPITDKNRNMEKKERERQREGEKQTDRQTKSSYLEVLSKTLEESPITD